jgi:ribonuclease Z
MLDVCSLGTAGTIPLPRRRLSATPMRVGGSLFCFSTAARARRWRYASVASLRRLKAILITHLHVDHKWQSSSGGINSYFFVALIGSRDGV